MEWVAESVLLLLKGCVDAIRCCGSRLLGSVYEQCLVNSSLSICATSGLDHLLSSLSAILSYYSQISRGLSLFNLSLFLSWSASNRVTSDVWGLVMRMALCHVLNILFLGL